MKCHCYIKGIIKNILHCTDFLYQYQAYQTRFSKVQELSLKKKKVYSPNACFYFLSFYVWVNEVVMWVDEVVAVLGRFYRFGNFP